MLIRGPTIQSFDDRRNIVVPGDAHATTLFAADYWIEIAEKAIAERSRFSVALSGGSTPNAIYKALASKPFIDEIDWSKVFLFWSDERAVPPNHPDSNYHNALKSGLSHLPIPPRQIFRMEAEHPDIQAKAFDYEKTIKKQLDSPLFDLVMLGVGEDGHTASLFPDTEALKVKHRLVVANYVPEKKSWRMTLTLEAIQKSRLAIIYALGTSKATIIKEVLNTPSPSPYPASSIGSKEPKSLWVIDKDASNGLS